MQKLTGDQLQGMLSIVSKYSLVQLSLLQNGILLTYLTEKWPARGLSGSCLLTLYIFLKVGLWVCLRGYLWPGTMWKCIWTHITSWEVRVPTATINCLAARQELKCYPSALLSCRELSTTVNSCKELSGREKAAPTFCFFPCVEKKKRKWKKSTCWKLHTGYFSSSSEAKDISLLLHKTQGACWDTLWL